MNEQAKQVGLEAIRSIREQLRTRTSGARVYTPEEKIIRATVSELDKLLLTSQSTCSQLSSLMSLIDDPFSPEYDQAEQTIETLNMAIKSAENLLNTLPGRYRILSKET